MAPQREHEERRVMNEQLGNRVLDMVDPINNAERRLP